tara:strand:+ start:491 stop:604 length:114 start_codon:yes stop_codon:yes gene_type:complete
MADYFGKMLNAVFAGLASHKQAVALRPVDSAKASMTP